jgi:hypothetical protein
VIIAKLRPFDISVVENMVMVSVAVRKRKISNRQWLAW